MKRLALAGAVVVVTNLFVLTGVWRNRSGAPLETIELSERELSPAWHHTDDENSGVTLRFNYYGQCELEQAKLEELGFDTRRAMSDPSDGRLLRRDVVLALEYAGPAWENWLQGLEKLPGSSEQSTKMQRETASRLFVVDAAARPEPLWKKYPDRQKYLIVRGVATAYMIEYDPRTYQRVPKHLELSVAQVLPSEIHVPLPHSSAFPAKHYTVVLNYGQRFEPWIANVKKID